MNDANNRNLLLKEYAEAGQISRQHEQLTRMSASVFVPTLLALAGYVFGLDAQSVVKGVLALAGFVTALLAANIIRRHQLYYRSYVARARAIESELKTGKKQIVKLYTDGKDAAKCSCTISSKTALIIFFVFIAMLFGGSSIFYFALSYRCEP
jgi:hypothetical protein